MVELVDSFAVDDVLEAIRRWDRTSEGDDFFYHVTTEANAFRIKTSGFIPNASRTMAEGFYRNYSRGKVFFCERQGVSFWIGRISDHLENDHDDPPQMAVLRFPKDALPEFYKDDLGTRDSHSPCYYITESTGPLKSLSS